MLQHAREFAQAGIPFIFDPGQGLPMFNGEELTAFIDQAAYVTVNDYEGQLLQERTGQSLEALAKRVRALIVTRGAEGSTIFADGRQLAIPSVKPRSLVDPTGCGDAYRAGLLYGIARGMDWETTGRLASLIGAIKIASRGGQNHRFDRAEIEARYKEAFRASPW
jgi:adenosine kinase